jgi:hypothetical protein
MIGACVANRSAPRRGHDHLQRSKVLCRLQIELFSLFGGAGLEHHRPQQVKQVDYVRQECGVAVSEAQLVSTDCAEFQQCLRRLHATTELEHYRHSGPLRRILKILGDLVEHQLAGFADHPRWLWLFALLVGLQVVITPKNGVLVLSTGRGEHPAVAIVLRSDKMRFKRTIISLLRTNNWMVQ